MKLGILTIEVGSTITKANGFHRWPVVTGCNVKSPIGMKMQRLLHELLFCIACRSARMIGASPWEFERRTGVIAVPNFSVTKIRWLMEQDRAVQYALASDDLLFGTIDSWLILSIIRFEPYAIRTGPLCQLNSERKRK